jgi:hypothetical protein
MESATQRFLIVILLSLLTAVLGISQTPIISSLSPTDAIAGGSGFTLTVTGAYFEEGCVVQWNAKARTTIFLGTTQVRATIDATDVAFPGTVQVVVVNPGGRPSPSKPFTIYPSENPAPAISAISPNAMIAGGPGFTITVHGSGFVPSSFVRCNAQDRPTIFQSPTTLAAFVPSTDLAVPTVLNIVVYNPAPGGGTSNALHITVSGAVDIRADHDREHLPIVSALHQNHPNPFNPSTTITYDLPASTELRLSIFDMLGCEVSVLVNGRGEAGIHEVTFDGSNLASGVYLYRLQAGDFVQTKRFVLLK